MSAPDKAGPRCATSAHSAEASRPGHFPDLREFRLIATRQAGDLGALEVVDCSPGHVAFRFGGGNRVYQSITLTVWTRTALAALSEGRRQIKSLFPSQQWDVALAAAVSEGSVPAAAKCGIRQPAPGARSLSEARGLSGGRS